MSRRLIALMALLVLSLPLLSAPVLAEDTQAQEIVFVEPTYPRDAVPYDSAHPDLLDADMILAHSAILIEASTGEVLFEKNADAIMFPASTTKILTAYIALQMADLDNDLVTISQNAIDLVPPTYTTVPLSAGEQVYMRDLIPAMLVRSGNEAANAIAEYLSGSIDNFAMLMNRTAQALGCSSDTHFSNPSGAHDANHYTTARDMAIIARAAMEDERFAAHVSKHTYDMPATSKADGSSAHPARQLVGGTSILNPESSAYYRDAIGIKTGYTYAAGRCFVGAAQKGSLRLISVVFYSSNDGQWSDTRRLLEYGFTQVESISPEALYAEDPRVIELAGFSLDDERHGEVTLSIRAKDESRDMTIIGNKARIDMLRENFNQISAVNWTREFRAPVEKGAVMGILTFYSENNGIAEYELLASRSVAAREDAPPTLEQIEAYTAADESIWPRFSWDLLVPPVLVLLALIWLRRFLRRHRRKRAKAPDIKPIKKRYVR